MTRVTLRDVAEDVGVAISTASRILAGQDGCGRWRYSDSTKRAVQDAATRLGYVRVPRRQEAEPRVRAVAYAAVSRSDGLRISKFYPRQSQAATDATARNQSHGTCDWVVCALVPLRKGGSGNG